MDITFPTAYEELFRPHRYKVYYGGRGGGKSWQFARALVLLGYDSALRILCTREVQKSIADSVHRLLCDQIEAMGLSWFYTVTRESIRGANGTEFIFKGLRSNSQEIKSTEGVDICWVEEAMGVSSDSWEFLIPTIRKDGSEIWVTFNPSEEKDPVYQIFLVNGAADAFVQKVNYSENPYFPDTLRKEMEWTKARDYQAYLHIWEGEVKRHSNALVFGNYFKVEEFDTPARVRFYHGADWGFANDPTTLIRCFIDGKRLYIDREAWGIGVEIDNTPALFDTIDTARKWPIKADSARPETISYMRRQGFKISAAKKWQGSVEDGIEYLKSYDIIIHPRCKHTIDEFNHYSYKIDRQTGDILPVIVDAWNHCLKGDTLVTCLDGDKQIKDVKCGDYVYTRQGLKKVLWSGKTRSNAQVFTVHAGGYTVTGTADHKIFTMRGWIAIGDLRKGDILLCMWKPSKPTGEFGIDTQILAGGQIENISSTAQHGYIGTHGNVNAGKYLMGWLSTIKMGIAKIIPSTILNVLPHSNTWIDTHALMKWQSLGRDILQKLDHSQCNGIKAKKDMSGTKSTLKNVISGILKKCGNVNSAEVNLRQPPTIINSAQMPAKVHGVEVRELTMRSEPAQSAVKNLPSTSITNLPVVLAPVQTVECGGIESAVYDLTVEDVHEFFANGILVHNCIDALRYSQDGRIHGKTGDWSALIS